MKKLALTMCLVLALASVASAADIAWGTAVEFKGSQSWTSGNDAKAERSDATGLTIKATASGENWDATAELGDLLGNPALGKWKVGATDGNLKVTTWGEGYELSDKGTPFDFVKSAKVSDPADLFKMRVEYAPVIVDLQAKNEKPVLYGFAEQTFDPATVGLGAKVLPHDNDATVAGYVKMNGLADMIDLTGSVGMQTSSTIKDNNSMFGVQGVVHLPASVTATAKFTSKAANVGNESVIYLEGVQDATHLLQLKGSYETKSKVEPKDTKSNTLTASVKARGDAGNKSYDDQFETDKYFENVAWGAMGEVKITKAATFNDDGTLATGIKDDKPTNTITVKGTTPIIPGKAWVLGGIAYKNDADSLGESEIDAIGGEKAVVLADDKSNTAVDVYGRYIFTDKVRFDGEVNTKSQGGGNYAKVTGKTTYKIASAKELYAKLEADGSKQYVGDTKNYQKLTLGFEVSF